MENADCKSECKPECKLIRKEYETTRARLLKGYGRKLDQICEMKNAEALARDGFLLQGRNRCNRADAIALSVDCFFEKYGLQSADVPAAV